MATTLTAVGTTTYNGVDFGVYCETLECTGRPVYDQAGRTVIYTVYTITLKTIVGGDGAATDTTMADVRRRLQTPGGAFYFTDKGFGDLTVNVSTKKDVVWGPKPQLLSWKPKGRACTLVWTVEVALPECATAGYAFKVMAFNYKVTIGTAYNGLSTRTYAGYLEIPQTRGAVNDRSLSDCADAYFERIVPPIPLGFQRMSRERTLNESKCRLDFAIVDEEMSGRLPPGCVKARASHIVSSGQKQGFTEWSNGIQAEYEMAKGYGAPDAYTYFYNLLNVRMRHAASDGTQGPKTKGTSLITSISVTEPDLYGLNRFIFSATWQLITSPETFIAASGIFRPIQGLDWNRWAVSLESVGVTKPRGYAGLILRPSDDAIIDLCQSTSSHLQPGSGGSMMNPKMPPFVSLQPKKIKPNESWLYYDSRLRIEATTEQIQHKPLPPGKHFKERLETQPSEVHYDYLPPNSERPEPAMKPPRPQYPPGDYIDGGVGGMDLCFVASEADIVQSRSTPTVHLILEGSALRAGFNINPPVLKQVGTAAVKLLDESIQTSVVANVGILIYGCKWMRRYSVLKADAAKFTAPPFPFP